MIEHLLHTIKVLTFYNRSPDIAVYEKRNVNESHSESFNVPLIDNNVDNNVSVYSTILLVSLKMKCVVMIWQLILH